MNIKFFSFIIIFNLIFCQNFKNSKIINVPNMESLPGIFTGLDILIERNFDLIKNKKIAIFTNQTAVDRSGKHMLDVLADYRDFFQIKTVFTPQYGILLNSYQNIEASENNIDIIFNSKIKRLWNNEYIPQTNDLVDIDIILVDIQDTGIRFHTLITTLTKIMESAATNSIPVLLLDRPNPLNGIIIDGPVVRPKYQSFIGYHLVPIRHGLTIGEYALMINETGWIRQSVKCDLSILPMTNWNRSLSDKDMNLPYWKNINNFISLKLSYGMTLFQGTNLSFGEGTSKPFQLIGSPWLVPDQLISGLRKKNLRGVVFRKTEFIPDSLSTLISNPLYKGVKCYGVELEIIDIDKFDPLHTALSILSIVANLDRRFKWTGSNYIDYLYGHNYLRLFISQKRDINKISATWSKEIIKFNEFRKRFLIYN